MTKKEVEDIATMAYIFGMGVVERLLLDDIAIEELHLNFFYDIIDKYPKVKQSILNNIDLETGDQTDEELHFMITEREEFAKHYLFPLEKGGIAKRRAEEIKYSIGRYLAV